jgi:DNA-binding NarL/FixJ family response regulator
VHNSGNSHDPPLSPIECEIMLLFAQGHGRESIAATLSLSVSAVEAHHTSLMHKLGLTSDTELVRQVLRERLRSKA